MPQTPFCSWQVVQDRVRRGLHIVPPNVLAPEWDGICADGAKDAAAEIEQIFVLKGYTVAQLQQCDMIRIWNSRLGAFFAFCNGTHLANYDLKSVEHLDCRKDMREAGALVIGGEPVAPTLNQSPVGGILSGQLDGVCEGLRDRDELRWPW